MESSKPKEPTRQERTADIEIPLDGEGRGYDDLAADTAAQGKFWETHLGLNRIAEMKKTDPDSGAAYSQTVYKRAGRTDSFMVVHDPYRGYEHFVPDVQAGSQDAGPTAEEARQQVLADFRSGGDWRKTLEENRAVLFSEYKIHLQPKKEYIPVIIDRLIKMTDEHPEIRQHISAFKAKLGGSVKDNKDGTSEQMPEIVVYPKLGTAEDADGKTEGRKNLELVLAAVMDAVRGLEDTGNGQVPRENARINELIFVAQAGGDLKNDLKKMGVIDQYMEKDSEGRYAFRKGEAPPSAEELEAGRRRLAAEAEARAEAERRTHTEREQKHLEKARNGLHQAFEANTAAAEGPRAAPEPQPEPAAKKTGIINRIKGLFGR